MSNILYFLNIYLKSIKFPVNEDAFSFILFFDEICYWRGSGVL